MTQEEKNKLHTDGDNVPSGDQENKDLQKEIETVVSDNENMEPVPDQEEEERRSNADS